jgi:hypothetical protein
MKPEDFDRILLAEKQIEPSATFERAVMTSVQAEAAAYGPRIPFPWVPFAAAVVILMVLVLRFYPADSILRATNFVSHTIANWMVAPSDVALRNALLSAFASLAGTLLLVWFSFRLAGTNR